MNKVPLISIIMPVYNGEKYLKDALDSVLKQSFSDFEVICIDDGSTDTSHEILTNYATQESRIKIIHQKNKGVIEARNNGVKQAKGTFIYFLDSDDIIDEKLLEKSYNAITAGKGDIITCRVMIFGRENKEMPLKKPTKINMARGNCLVNATLLRKSLFDKTGGFDRAFREGLEDYDLWCHMIYRQKASFYRIPELLFYYRLKPDSESRNAQARLHCEDLIKRLWAKYPEMLWYRKLYKLSTFFFQKRLKKNKIIFKFLKIPLFFIKQKEGTQGNRPLLP